MFVLAVGDPSRLRAAESKEELTQALAALKELGLRVQGRSLITEAELELRKRLAAEKKLRKEIELSQRSLRGLLDEDRAYEATYTQLRAQHRQLNAQLAQARNSNQNNRIVAAMNELGHQLEQVAVARKQLVTDTEAARADYSKKRDAYIKNILDARQAASAAEQVWKERANSDAFRGAVENYNQLAARPVELAPSKTLATQLRSLQRLEKSVLVDSIPLRRDGGGTFQVDVVVNDQRTMPMVVDSGASLVCLPHQDAVAAKLNLEGVGEPIILMIADGTQVKAQRITIPTLRIGQFSADQVEAAVLPPEMANAPALLGMSFLRNFQVSIDSDAATLSMSQLKEE